MRLLIAFDGSAAAQAAVAAAGALFAPAAATVLHVRDPKLVAPPEGTAPMRLPADVVERGLGELEHAAAARARSVLADGEQLARAAGLEAETRLATGSRPWRCIEAAALELDTDLIVTGTHGRPPIGRAFLGSTASSLLHHAPAPVLVVPPGAAQPTYRIVLGFDGSPSSERALRFAAEHLGAHEVLVTHVWRSPIRHSAGGELLRCLPLDVVREFIDDYDASWAASARDTAERGVALAGELGLRAEPRIVESAATPWHGLLQAAAKEHSSLIVTGAERENPITAALGSVSSGLVHHASSAILVVPLVAAREPAGASATPVGVSSSPPPG